MRSFKFWNLNEKKMIMVLVWGKKKRMYVTNVTLFCSIMFVNHM